MHIMEKLCMNFKNILHQNKLVLTFYNMYEQNLVWGTKKDKTSVWKKPLSEEHKFYLNWRRWKSYEIIDAFQV